MDYRLKLYRGAWCVVWNDGTTRRASLRTQDREEAERRFADYLKALEVQEGTVGEIMTAYLAEKAGVSSADSMKFAWAAMQPTFGSLRPDQVTRGVCRAYATKRKKAGRSSGTIIKELACLKAGLRWHDRNTPAVIEVPQAPPPRERHLTRDEFERLVAACKSPHMRLFVILALTTAARTRAVLDLTWDRVNFEKGQIDLRLASETRRKGRAVVPMTERARAALEEACKGRTTDHVIEFGGKPVGRIIKAFRAAANDAGLEGVTPHILRHTAAVWMAAAGVSMARIAQYLGHDNSRTTEAIYARFAPEHLVDASKALEW